ncbi:MAG: GAF domain-containing protein, partial [Bacteroidota bacterium]
MPEHKVSNTLLIKIHTSWYLSWWFTAILILVIVSVIYAIYRLIKASKKEINQLGNEVTKSQKTLARKNEELQRKNAELTERRQRLKELQDHINAVSRIESLEGVCEKAMEDMIDFFEFDYASLSLFDPISRKITVKYNRARLESRVDPSEWQGGEIIRILDEKEYDILPLVLEAKRPILVDGNMVDGKEVAIDENAILDYRLYEKHKHGDLVRGFFPMIRRSEDKEGKLDLNIDQRAAEFLSQFGQEAADTVEGDTPIGIFEVGYHRTTHQHIDKQKKLDLKLYIDNCAQPYFRAYQSHQREEARRDLAELGKEASVEAFLRKSLEVLSERFHADFADAFLVPFDHSRDWKPLQTVGYKVDDKHLVQVYDKRKKSKGLYVKAIQDRKVYISSDVSQDTDFVADGLEIKGLLVTPLVYHERAIGGICLYSKNDKAFDVAHENLIKLYQEELVDLLMAKRANEAIQNLTKPFSIFSDQAFYENLGRGLEDYFLEAKVGVWRTSGESSEAELKYERCYISPRLANVPHSYTTSSATFSDRQTFDNLSALKAIPQIRNWAGKKNFRSAIYIPIGTEHIVQAHVWIFAQTPAQVKLAEFDELFLSLLHEKATTSLRLLRTIKALSSLAQLPGKQDIELRDYLKSLCGLGVDLLEADPVTLFTSQSDKLDEKLRYRDGYYAGGFKDRTIIHMYEGKSKEAEREVALPNRIMADAQEEFFRDFRSEDELIDYINKTGSNPYLEPGAIEPFWVREDIKSVVAVRLQLQDTPLGVMFFNYRRERTL